MIARTASSPAERVTFVLRSPHVEVIDTSNGTRIRSSHRTISLQADGPCMIAGASRALRLFDAPAALRSERAGVAGDAQRLCSEETAGYAENPSKLAELTRP